MQIKRSALDALFSRYIRTRAHWRCEVCGKPYPPPTRGLHCCHVFGRGKKSVRWNPDNAFAGCLPCHRRMDSFTTEKWNWQAQRLGPTRWNDLRRQAATPGKPDQALILLWLRQELKRLEAA